MNGLFNVYKPFGISSAKVVWLLKKKFNIKDKIGHMGTLDPNATGVLVIGVGRANRLFDVLLNKTKTYVATFEFGYETETLDMESNVLTKTSTVIPTKEQIEQNLKLMIGKQQQTAPIYSAKNVDGTRAYMLARSGKSVEIKPHNIEIFDFKLTKQLDSTKFEFEIECSSGTYIRSIARDFAEKLGTCATMIALKRTKSGLFNIENSKLVENLTEEDLIPNDFVLQNFETLNIPEEQIQKLKNGVKLNLTGKQPKDYKVYSNNKLVGIANVSQEHIATMKTWLV